MPVAASTASAPTRKASRPDRAARHCASASLVVRPGETADGHHLSLRKTWVVQNRRPSAPRSLHMPSTRGGRTIAIVVDNAGLEIGEHDINVEVIGNAPRPTPPDR